MAFLLLRLIKPRGAERSLQRAATPAQTNLKLLLARRLPRPASQHGTERRLPWNTSGKTNARELSLTRPPVPEAAREGRWRIYDSLELSAERREGSRPRRLPLVLLLCSCSLVRSRLRRTPRVGRGTPRGAQQPDRTPPPSADFLLPRHMTSAQVGGGLFLMVPCRFLFDRTVSTKPVS